MKNPKTIRALFAFPGFTTSSKLVGVFGDRFARVLQLKRRKKQPSVRTVDTAAGVMAGSVAVPVHAETAAQTQNLFENAGKKQVGADFKPAPDKIKTNFGTLQFDLEAFPTEETTQKIYHEMDLQRATQAYMDFYPALSVYAIVKSQIRDFKFKTSSDIAVAAGPGWKPSEPFHMSARGRTYTTG